MATKYRIIKGDHVEPTIGDEGEEMIAWDKSITLFFPKYQRAYKIRKEDLKEVK